MVKLKCWGISSFPLMITETARVLTSVTTSATSDPSQAGAVAGPSTSQAGASAASLPHIDPAVKELNETLVSMHHNLVKLLEKAGVKNY